MDEHLKDLIKFLGNIPTRKEFVEAFKNVVDRVQRTEKDIHATLDAQVDKVDQKLSTIRSGVDGKNPLTVSATPPPNPQPGDLWYQP